MSQQNGEEKKKYRVVDRRGSYDDVPPAAQESQAPEPPPADAVADQQPPPAQQPPPEQGQEEPRKVRMEDVLALIMNMLRDQALLSLGMHFAKDAAPAEPDLGGAKKAAELFRALAAEFDDMLAPMMPPDQEAQALRRQDLGATLIMALNILQSQIVVQLGLMADPATGLVLKDMDQAKKGIDMLAALSEKFRPLLPAQAAGNIDAMLADLRMNYVNQLNMPS